MKAKKQNLFYDNITDEELSKLPLYYRKLTEYTRPEQMHTIKVEFFKTSNYLPNRFYKSISSAIDLRQEFYE